MQRSLGAIDVGLLRGLVQAGSNGRWSETYEYLHVDEITYYRTGRRHVGSLAR
ncbi:MAG: hypothetical protein M3P48_05430 [Actinomycetota bacterium]|nr:hypothetical protein [Actinomycetota bacterium]